MQLSPGVGRPRSPASSSTNLLSSVLVWKGGPPTSAEDLLESGFSKGGFFQSGGLPVGPHLPEFGTNAGRLLRWMRRRTGATGDLDEGGRLKYISLSSRPTPRPLFLPPPPHLFFSFSFMQYIFHQTPALRG